MNNSSRSCTEHAASAASWSGLKGGRAAGVAGCCTSGTDMAWPRRRRGRSWQTWGVRSWRCTLHRQDAGEITANEENVSY
jgi:hypothetical protein